MVVLVYKVRKGHILGERVNRLAMRTALKLLVVVGRRLLMALVVQQMADHLHPTQCVNRFQDILQDRETLLHRNRLRTMQG